MKHLVLTGLLIITLVSGCTKSLDRDTRNTPLPVRGKKTAPFKTDFTVPGSAAKGETVSASVTLTAVEAAGDFTLSITGKGLEIQDFQPISSARIEKGESVTAEFTARITQEGINYIKLLAEGTYGERRLPFTLSIPINTGAEPEKRLEKTGNPDTDHAGRKIIKMKATERSNQ